MVFTSFNFMVFFPLLAMFYWITPAKYKLAVLLVASYFFYINVKPAYALLLAGVTLSTFYFTNLIAKSKKELVLKVGRRSDSDAVAVDQIAALVARRKDKDHHG